METDITVGPRRVDTVNCPIRTHLTLVTLRDQLHLLHPPPYTHTRYVKQQEVVLALSHAFGDLCKHTAYALQVCMATNPVMDSVMDPVMDSEKPAPYV